MLSATPTWLAMPMEPLALIWRMQPRFPVEKHQLIGVFRRPDATESTFIPVPPKRSEAGEMRNTVRWPDFVVVDELVRAAALELQLRIRQHIEEDVQDAASSGEAAPPQAALSACFRLGEQLVPHLVLAPGVRIAAFVEEGGVVGLVIQSLITDRRLTCRFASDGRTMLVLRVNEAMSTEQSTLAANDAKAPRELAEWVINPA